MWKDIKDGLHHWSHNCGQCANIWYKRAMSDMNLVPSYGSCFPFLYHLISFLHCINESNKNKNKLKRHMAEMKCRWSRMPDLQNLRMGIFCEFFSIHIAQHEHKWRALKYMPRTSPRMPTTDGWEHIIPHWQLSTYFLELPILRDIYVFDCWIVLLFYSLSIYLSIHPSKTLVKLLNNDAATNSP